MRIAKIIQRYTIILALTLIITGAAHAATTVEVGIPGQVAAGGTINGIPEYIKYLYYFVLGLVGIAGFASLVFWGAVWAGSGIVDKKAQAISGIKNTFTGIGIALTAFILLNTINPDLVVIKTPNVSDVGIQGNANTTKAEMAKTQIDLARKDCQLIYNQASCKTDSRCEWYSGFKNQNMNFCTEKRYAVCYDFTIQYRKCWTDAWCGDEIKESCNNNSNCQFSGNSCEVKL